MVKFSDDELAIIMAARQAAAAGSTPLFLQMVAQELAPFTDVGVGVVHRVAKSLQRKFHDPPLADRDGTAG